MNLSSSSPQPPRRPSESLKKQSSTQKNLFGTTSPSIDPAPRQNSPALSPGSGHPFDQSSSSSSRPSNSSIQSNPFSSSHTPPGTWSVSGKLVRKKASGLFREAARSWGRSRSKEVLSFGLGVLIGNQDAQPASSTTQSTLPPLPPASSNLSSFASPFPDQSAECADPNQVLQPQTTPSSVGTIIKGPKKRISFHSTKKVKGKSKENSKLKRRSEIGFGDWADTLNTAVASSSPQPQPRPIHPDQLDKLCDTSSLPPPTTQVQHPLSTVSPPGHLYSQSSESMAIPLRRRDRSVHLTKHLAGIAPTEVEAPASAPLSRVPRSTFPHAHRSPRSPRRFYNTRSAVHRSQSSQNLARKTSVAPDISIRQSLASHLGLTQYQQPDPLTSSPFKRSVSPINQFEDDFDVESPIASKSHGRWGSKHEHQLRSVASARANLFGAMPNQSGGLESCSRPTSVSNSFTPRNPQRAHSLSQFRHEPPTDPTTTSNLSRSRQRTVSASLQESISKLNSQYLTPLAEDGCDTDRELDGPRFDCPFSSPTMSPVKEFGRSANSEARLWSSHQKHGSQESHDRPIESWAMPRIEGLDMTPRHRSLDELFEESDVDDRLTQAGSSKPSSTTSVLSNFTQLDSQTHALSRPSSCSLKVSGCAFDGFGALPPPESPFPGPNRIKRAGSNALPPSPNKLKRDVDGEVVGSASNPTLYRHRTIGQPSHSSFPSSRSKSDPFEPFRHPQRDSWGRHSNGLSDDDDDVGVVSPHERGPNPGSHESHEAFSNLSVPGLTDSSSLASSLASSNQSSNPYNMRPSVDGATLLSTTWDKSQEEPGREAKRRSLPTNVGRTAVHSFAPVPPLPIGPVSTPVSVKPSSFAHSSLRHLVPPADSSFRDNESSFQSIKPNASAFLSSGMISKKTVARDRRENSLNHSSSLLQYALLNVGDPNSSISQSSVNMSGEASVAVKSMCEALGGPRVIVAALREDEANQSRLTEQYERSYSSSNSYQPFSPHQGSLGVILPDGLRRSSVSSLRMPDTPIKKPAGFHKSHAQINKPFMPSGLRKQSSSYLPFIDGSPTDNSPTSRCHQSLVPESPIPHLQSPSDDHIHPSILLKDPRPCSLSSKWVASDDCEPSRSDATGQASSGFEAQPKHSPMYRRRSSDGVLSHHNGGGNSSKGITSLRSNPFDDPGTPTKVAPGWLKRAPQLLTSPGTPISSVTSSPSIQNQRQVHHQLITANSSTEQLLDSQITPNRTGNHSYPSFAISPIIGMNDKSSSRPHLTPGPEYSSSPSMHRPSFQNRHSSPAFDDNRRHILGGILNSQCFQRERFESEFDILETIGSGEFGEVFKARQESTGKVYAVKRSKRTASGPKALGRQYEEVDILRRLTQGSARTSYVIQLYDAWQDSNRWYLQTEYCENGTLERFLELIAGLQDRVDEERIWKITSELIQAAAFMHASGVLHLDIKPANIFITAHGGLKVGDFGLARRWPRIDPKEVRECGLLNNRYKIYQHAPTTTSSQEPDSVNVIPPKFLRYEDIADTEERQMMRLKSCGRFVGFDLEREGDREYIAPEILSGRYGEEADVFSVGLIALEIATNVVLPDNGDEWRSLRSSDFSRTDLSHLSSELVLLIKRMMDKSPDRRVTAAELTRHPVLSKLQGLREIGLAQEAQGILQEGAIDDEESEVLQETSDHAGDIQMAPVDDVGLIPEHIKPVRPRPPIDNVWRFARGAVLPEAKGFLQFILTGQSTPSRLKLSVMPCTNNTATDSCPKPLVWSTPLKKVGDEMEIDV